MKFKKILNGWIWGLALSLILISCSDIRVVYREDLREFHYYEMFGHGQQLPCSFATKESVKKACIDAAKNHGQYIQDLKKWGDFDRLVRKTKRKIK